MQFIILNVLCILLKTKEIYRHFKCAFRSVSLVEELFPDRPHGSSGIIHINSEFSKQLESFELLKNSKIVIDADTWFKASISSSFQLAISSQKGLDLSFGDSPCKGKNLLK